MCPDDRSEEILRAPWEHPDWYDLHDVTWTAGPEREPEHYRELVLALPPLDAGDHLVDYRFRDRVVLKARWAP